MRPRPNPIPRQFRRRGVSALWVLCALPAVVGFCSLAVDYGHCVLVKSELQNAADAACRYACAGIAAGVTTAQNYAIDAANDNTADGTPVVLDPTTDIEFGTWNASNETFTPLTGAARSSANALRITARRTAASGNPVQLGFARLIGKPTADVKAVAIATATQGTTATPYGIVGLGYVNMSGSSSVDSYNAAAGPYSAASARTNGNVISNSWVNLSGNVSIKGDVHAGKSAGINKNGSASITGSTANQTSNLSYAMPTTPASYTNLGNVNLSGNSSLTLSGGNYYASSFSLGGSADVYVTGPVTLYVNGGFGLGGAAAIHVLNNLPSNFKVRMVSSGGVNLGGNTSLYADVYAPSSPVNISGSGDLFGAVISNGISLSGNADIHYDESLGYGPGGAGTGGASTSGTISLVK